MSRHALNTQRVDIAVVRLPQISNYDDVLALEHEAGVAVRFVQQPGELAGADLVILPGTKSTIADLNWLRQTGLAAELCRRAGSSGRILGICGGCQMLGELILDPEGVESPCPTVPGLGLLGLTTRFARPKLTAQVEAEPDAPSFLTRGLLPAMLSGYEIHMGQLSLRPTARSPFRLRSRNGTSTSVLDGAISASGNVVGTMLHGVLENASLRASLLGTLRADRGLEPPPSTAIATREAEYDRLEEAVRAALDLPLLRRLALGPRH